jgi:chromosome segregation ATPase
MLEAEVLHHVDDILSDPERVTRDLDEAIARETATIRNPAAEFAALADQVAECSRMRDKFQEQEAHGYMTLDELGAKLDALNERRAVAERGLDRLRQDRGRLEELKAQRRFVLETFGEGLALGLFYCPPQLRRAVYELLRLKITVGADGSVVHVEGDLDANMVRVSEDLERYAARLNEAKRRYVDLQAGDEDAGELIEMYENELRLIRQELSPATTDITSSLMSKLA